MLLLLLLLRPLLLLFLLPVLTYLFRNERDKANEIRTDVRSAGLAGLQKPEHTVTLAETISYFFR
jgi:hypothetical protein